jgi:hypothetical protein
MLTNPRTGESHMISNYLSMPKSHHSGRHLSSGLRKTTNFTPKMIKDIKKTQRIIHNMHERTRIPLSFV